MKNTSNRRREITLWTGGFAELVAGKPFHVRRDEGFEPDDILVVREYDQGSNRLTGKIAMFRITWVTRATDHSGMLSGLLPPDAVILGLAPANVMVVDGGRVAMLVNGHSVPEPRAPEAPAPNAAGPDVTVPNGVPAGPSTAPGRPALGDLARSEARRLLSVAREHRLDPRELADALHRELARAPTVPGTIILQRPAAAASPPS